MVGCPSRGSEPELGQGPTGAAGAAVAVLNGRDESSHSVPCYVRLAPPRPGPCESRLAPVLLDCASNQLAALHRQRRDPHEAVVLHVRLVLVGDVEDAQVGDDPLYDGAADV